MQSLRNGDLAGFEGFPEFPVFRRGIGTRSGRSILRERRTGKQAGGEWDFFYRLDPKERKRLKKSWRGGPSAIIEDAVDNSAFDNNVEQVLRHTRQRDILSIFTRTGRSRVTEAAYGGMSVEDVIQPLISAGKVPGIEPDFNFAEFQADRVGYTRRYFTEPSVRELDAVGVEVSDTLSNLMGQISSDEPPAQPVKVSQELNDLIGQIQTDDFVPPPQPVELSGGLESLMQQESEEYFEYLNNNFDEYVQEAGVDADIVEDISAERRLITTLDESMQATVVASGQQSGASRVVAQTSSGVMSPRTLRNVIQSGETSSAIAKGARKLMGVNRGKAAFLAGSFFTGYRNWKQEKRQIIYSFGVLLI